MISLLLKKNHVLDIRKRFLKLKRIILELKVYTKILKKKLNIKNLIFSLLTKNYTALNYYKIFYISFATFAVRNLSFKSNSFQFKLILLASD